MVNAPCYKCLRRSAICHGSCTEYHEWVAQLQAERKLMRKANDADAHIKRTIEVNAKRANTIRRVGQL